MKKSLLILTFLLVAFGVRGQQLQPQKPSVFQMLKQLRGNFVLDAGITNLASGQIPTDALNSRSVGLSFLYHIRLADHLSVGSGLGLQWERIALAEGKTFIQTQNGSTMQVTLTDAVAGIPFATPDIKKSILATSYLDLPLELRAVTHTGRRTFRVVAGVKLSVLLNSHTKVKYTDLYGEIDKFSHYGNLYLHRVRAGIYGRVGYKTVHLFGHYSLMPLFEEGKLADTANQNITPFTLGMSLMLY